jgi:zinc protease
VTLDQANAALRARISGDDFVVTVVGTAGEIESAVEKAVPKLSSKETAPFDRE